jgi:hypothetical protein
MLFVSLALVGASRDGQRAESHARSTGISDVLSILSLASSTIDSTLRRMGRWTTAGGALGCHVRGRRRGVIQGRAMQTRRSATSGVWRETLTKPDYRRPS